MRVGFIGLGSMGAPMARRIADHGGFELAVWARRADTLTSFLDGRTRVAATPAELGEGLDVLCTCVFDAEGTHETLFGPGGAVAAMPAGAVVVCHSTVAPQEAVALAKEVAEHGLLLLDVPVSGGPGQAEVGKLVAMVGGSDEAFARARPVLETFADPIVRLGGVGAGQQAKLINNSMLAAHVTLADDAFRIAAELGMDPRGLATVLHGGSGRSYGADLLAAFGSAASAAGSPLAVAMAKDVPLLTDMVAPLDLPTILLPAADELLRRLGSTAG